ncbi:protein of unknown function [Modestobacter italicus]|uniref:Uncharacterized protein n=1 Tax=Modestobacter italicus (strain DSM 44449 / CECT 9708 / BC 501) TaxID=2732864 RepID=I4EXM4_MODI5|nr:hypothetical protein [Modestobacter marinus]CCH88137.1 protein of unknown function [Modestobacter marinus]
MAGTGSTVKVLATGIGGGGSAGEREARAVDVLPLEDPGQGRGREELAMPMDTPAPRLRGRRCTDAGNRSSAARLGGRLRPLGWTDAHTEAAWFVGECVGAGAVLGVVAALGRSAREG